MKYQPHHAGAGEAGEPFEYKLSERWKARDDNGYPIVSRPGVTSRRSTATKASFAGGWSMESTRS